LGWTQERTAKWFGVTESTIWNWESGGITPSHLFRTAVRVFLGETSRQDSLPEQLRGLRWRRGMTQHDLASMLGVNPSTVEDWETGRCEPRRSNWVRISELLRDEEGSANAKSAGFA
jgi:DNA-binding XRE family transcriptional regulator